jgi:hypothetical protein
MESVELQMPFDETYLPALSIPVNDCQRFSTRPLSWLRYVASTIYGGGGGDISTSRDGAAVNYGQADVQAGIYYYVSRGESFWYPRNPSSLLTLG